MNDDQLERALRAGPDDDPAYAPLGFGVESLRREPVHPVSRAGFRVGASGLIVVAVVIGALLLRPRLANPDASSGLPADIRESGRLRIVVANGSQQRQSPDGSVEGFDADVARALAARIGINATIDIVDAELIDGGGWADRWDVALDSAPATAERAGRFALARPYYWRSAGVLGSVSGLERVADLDGRLACVYPGSLAEQWLRGDLALVYGSAVEPPTSPRIEIADIDGSTCRPQSGLVALPWVVDWAYGFTATVPGWRMAPFVPFVAGSSPAVDPSRPEAVRLIAAIDTALDSMRADGTLRRLSERWFSGQDLTSAPGS